MCQFIYLRITKRFRVNSTTIFRSIGLSVCGSLQMLKQTKPQMIYSLHKPLFTRLVVEHDLRCGQPWPLISSGKSDINFE